MKTWKSKFGQIARPAASTAAAGPPATVLPQATTANGEFASFLKRAHEDKAETLEQIDGRYDLVEELAVGGMGRVYRAFDRVLNRNIALKILRSRFMQSDDIALRFTEEAQIMARLQHPGIVPVYETGKLRDGRPYIAMKLIQGCTLKDLLQERISPRQDLAHYINVFEQVCQTVAYAHSRGIIHRDIKPENIMVGAFGEVQVMDWGLAKNCLPNGHPTLGAGLPPSRDSAIDDLISDEEDTKVFKVGNMPRKFLEGTATNAGQILGTFQYMPPEQARGEIESLDFRTDVFALGALLCELLTGQPPYSPVKSEARRQAQEADLRLAFERLNDSNADADLVQLAKQCLNENPEDRPKDTEAVAMAIGSHLRGVQERRHNDLVRNVAAHASIQQVRSRVKAVRQIRRITLLCSIALVAIALSGAALALGYRSERNALAYEHHLKQQLAIQQIGFQLNEVDGLLKQGWSKAGDPVSWQGDLTLARRTLDNAQALLMQYEDLAELDGRYRASREECESAWRDCELLGKLDRIWLDDDDIHPDFDRSRRIADHYLAAFESHELKPLAGTADEARERMALSRIRPEVRTHLLNWLSASINTRDRERLTALIPFSGDQQRNVFDQLRQALEKSDQQTLLGLVSFILAADFEPQELVVIAAQMRHGGANEAAERLLSNVAASGSGLYYLNRELGLLYNSIAGRESDAVRYFTATSMIRPAEVQPHVDLAMALFKDDKTNEGVHSLRTALKIDPKNVDANWFLAKHLRETGRYPDAVKCYATILEQPEKLSLAMAGRVRHAGAVTAIQASLTAGDAAAGDRSLALKWLSEQWTATESTRQPSDRAFFESWCSDTRLAPVRNPTLLEELPEMERVQWTEFWRPIHKWLEQFK